MENEVKEVIELEEGLTTEMETTNQKKSKVVILGLAVATAVSAVLFKMRNKISSKIDNGMIKKLEKKGFVILNPTTATEVSEELEALQETFIENL